MPKNKKKAESSSSDSDDGPVDVSYFDLYLIARFISTLNKYLLKCQRYGF